MTTRIVIIDDEVFVRKGIASSIDWSRYDIEIAGEASNGAAGLELIRSVRPDIVLTDIKMPQMDGLAMIRAVRREFPRMKILVMSVLEDFETVREALRLHVVDYVQKFLIQPDNLLGIILDIQRSLREEESDGAAEPEESGSGAPAALRPEIKQAMLYVQQKYSTPLRIQDAAGAAGLSESYFSSLFSAETGTTFSQYVQEYRIGQAKRMLEESGCDWHDISGRVGFDDPKYFTKVFKRYTGMTPIQYYRKHAKVDDGI